MKLTIQSLFALTLVLAATLAAGRHETSYEQLPVADKKFLLDWRGEFSDAQRTKLKSWMVSVGKTVSLLYGELPRDEIRIALQPYPSRSAVPFARVLRNKPEGVLFYINPDYPLNDFIQDWTAYHELSHLFIPYPGIPDVWFSEGLASYYQNILQVRAGLLTPEQARQKLSAAFARGRDDDRNANLTLGELSAVMRERHAFMRVYWSGALYFLDADIRLRRLENPLTLDDVLREFGNCCLMNPGRWDGMRIVSDFDEIVGQPLFIPLYEAYEQTSAMPDYEAMLAAPEMDAILSPNPPTGALSVQ
jgi:hypothetical protein